MKRRLMAVRRVVLAVHGFTILETLIVMGISSVMFVSVSATIYGRQHRTEFTQAIQDVKSQIQQVVNEAGSGFYTDPSKMSCQPDLAAGEAAGHEHTINSPAVAVSGANRCMFLGKVLQFNGDTTDKKNEFRVLTLLGAQKDAQGKQITNYGTIDNRDPIYANTKPLALAPATGNTVPDFSDTRKLLYGLTLKGMKYESVGYKYMEPVMDPGTRTFVGENTNGLNVTWWNGIGGWPSQGIFEAQAWNTVWDTSGWNSGQCGWWVNGGAVSNIDFNWASHVGEGQRNHFVDGCNNTGGPNAARFFGYFKAPYTGDYCFGGTHDDYFYVTVHRAGGTSYVAYQSTYNPLFFRDSNPDHLPGFCDDSWSINVLGHPQAATIPLKAGEVVRVVADWKNKEDNCGSCKSNAYVSWHAKYNNILIWPDIGLVPMGALFRNVTGTDWLIPPHQIGEIEKEKDGEWRDISSIAFVNNLASYGTNSLVSGATNLNLVPIEGSSLSETDSQKAVSTVNTWFRDKSPVSPTKRPFTVNPSSGVEMCFVSDGTNQSGLITIGGSRQLSVTLKITEDKTCGGKY